jgi:hypothetical protein
MNEFSKLQVFPEVAISSIWISGFDPSAFSAHVLHVFGKEQTCPVSHTGEINVTGLRTGTYFVKVKANSSEQTYCYKFIKV